MVSERAPHAAIRADRIHLPCAKARPRTVGRGEGAGRASLHALAACDTGTFTHCDGLVEHDLRRRTPTGQTDDVVALFLTARAKTARALDTRIEVDANGRVGIVGAR